ncbi:MAG: hypothetical protein QOE87_3026 [Gaiellales bacterium]|nr:hypothetical protein [Gaiellales bacterium]
MSGRPSRLRRARRVVAGGLVGGAVVIARRRRRREPAIPQRGSDPLAAFEDAPCYPAGEGVKSG